MSNAYSSPSFNSTCKMISNMLNEIQNLLQQSQETDMIRIYALLEQILEMLQNGAPVTVAAFSKLGFNVLETVKTALIQPDGTYISPLHRELCDEINGCFCSECKHPLFRFPSTETETYPMWIRLFGELCDLLHKARTAGDIETLLEYFLLTGTIDGLTFAVREEMRGVLHEALKELGALPSEEKIADFKSRVGVLPWCSCLIQKDL